MEAAATADHSRTTSSGRSSRSSHSKRKERSPSRHSHSRRSHSRSSRHGDSTSSRQPQDEQCIRPAANTCWVCGAQALPGKLVCQTCLEEATRDKEADAVQASNIIRETVKESILQVATSESIGQSTPASTPFDPQDQEDSPEEEEVLVPTSFNFALIDPFARAVKEAIGWEEERDAPCKLRKYFPNLKRDPETFPFIDDLEELIKDEWQKPDKKSGLNNRLAKLYPLKEPKVNPLIAAPVVDSSLMRLARHVTLPIEDAVTFRDIMDRKIDLDLKRAYSAAGGACRPAVTLAAVGRAISSWASNIEKLLLLYTVYCL